MIQEEEQEQQQQQQQPQQPQQSQQAQSQLQCWRDDSKYAKSNISVPMALRNRMSPEDLLDLRLMNKISKRCMTIKSMVLEDMLSKFRKEESIKDRLHLAKKSITKTNFFTRNIKNAALRYREEENDDNISELVTKMKSSKFKIAADPKLDFNIARGISTMSCYDKTPREPPVEMSGGSSLDSRPNVNEIVEKFDVTCDFFCDKKALQMQLES